MIFLKILRVVINMTVILLLVIQSVQTNKSYMCSIAIAVVFFLTRAEKQKHLKYPLVDD